MKRFAGYLIPSLIASVFMSMYAMIDGIFIGQKIGDVGLAAINIVWPITAFLQAIGTALGLAGGIYIQRKMAEDNLLSATKMKLTVLMLGGILACLFGLLFYAVRRPLLQALGTTEDSFPYAMEYLRIILIGALFQVIGTMLIPLLKNSNKVKLAAVASMTAIFTNLILDYVMIYCLDMSLMGAALASVLAQIASALVCLTSYRKELKGITLKKEELFEIFKMSIAPFILTFSYSIVIMITNIVCTHIGGDEAVAAYTLLSYIAYILMAISCAVGDSLQPLFSFQAAKKEYQKNKKMLSIAILISFFTILAFVLLLVILKQPMGRLYNLSDIAFQYYYEGLLYYLLGGILISVFKVIASYLYAIDSKIFANILIILEPFVLTPLFLACLAIPLQMTGVWIAYLFVQICLVGVSLLLLYFEGKKQRKSLEWREEV